MLLLGLLPTSVSQYGTREVQAGTAGLRSCEYPTVFCGQNMPHTRSSLLIM